MTNPADLTGISGAAVLDDGVSRVSQCTDPADDVFAWTGVFLADGRVVSLAWLRNWPGAVEGRWRRD